MLINNTHHIDKLTFGWNNEKHFIHHLTNNACIIAFYISVFFFVLSPLFSPAHKIMRWEGARRRRRREYLSMWTRRCLLCTRIIVSFFVFFFVIFVVRAEELEAIANGEEEKETLLNKKRNFPEDVSGTFKGAWHASSTKSFLTPLREIPNKRYFASGSKGILQVQMRQQKKDSKNNCFWVEGDLLVRTTSEIGRATSF